MNSSLFIACCLLAGTFSGCTSTPHEEDKSDFARLHLGSFFAGATYEIRGHRITVTRMSDVAKTRKESRLLSDDEVRQFWKELESQRVSSWRPSYIFQVYDKRPACSYLSWELTVMKNSKEVHIRGCDAYPRDRDPRQMIEHQSSKRFDRVCNAFSRSLPD